VGLRAGLHDAEIIFYPTGTRTPTPHSSPYRLSYPGSLPPGISRFNLFSWKYINHYSARGREGSTSLCFVKLSTYVPKCFRTVDFPSLPIYQNYNLHLNIVSLLLLQGMSFYVIRQKCTPFVRYTRT
jgi:hypothetical protein